MDSQTEPRPATAREVGTSSVHVGPNIDTVGGTQSVIRSMRDNAIGADRVRILSTWDGPEQLKNFRLTARAGVSILRSPKDTLMHFHISARLAWVREGALIRLANALGYRVVATIHGHDFPEFSQAHPKLVRSILSHADHVIVLSETDLTALRAMSPQAPASIVANPIALDDDAPPASATPPIVLFAGAIGVRKGVDTLVEAWALLLDEGIDGECWIVGPHEDYEPRELERLRVLPAVHPSEVRALLRQVRVVALPSRSEAMPMILTEALAGGRPFVSTPVGGIATIAPDPDMLVPVGDAAALAKALGRYLRDPERAERDGALGQAHIAATRSPAVVDARLREIYEGL